MTNEQISRINYIIGRIEGIASGCEKYQEMALMDTAEMLEDLIKQDAEAKE